MNCLIEDESNIANIVSLFDGISCARVALERAGIKVERIKNEFNQEIEKIEKIIEG